MTSPAAKSVRAIVAARGRHASNIWLVYSPKTNQDWVLRSDLEEQHWLLLEADPEVVGFTLGPSPIVGIARGEPRAATPDALVKLRSGAIELREVKYRCSMDERDVRAIEQQEVEQEASAERRVVYRLVTEDDINPHALLVENSRRVVAALARVRTQWQAIAAYSQRAFEALRRSGSVRLHEVCAGADDPAKAAAGVFALLIEGKVRSDLDVAYLSQQTQFWLRDEAAEGRPILGQEDRNRSLLPGSSNGSPVRRFDTSTWTKLSHTGLSAEAQAALAAREAAVTAYGARVPLRTIEQDTGITGTYRDAAGFRGRRRMAAQRPRSRRCSGLIPRKVDEQGSRWARTNLGVRLDAAAS